MESFLNFKPKDIKRLKEQIQEVFNLNDETEIDEEKIESYMLLVELFQDTADELKEKIYDFAGYNDGNDTEEDNTPEKPVLG